MGLHRALLRLLVPADRLGDCFQRIVFRPLCALADINAQFYISSFHWLPSVDEAVFPDGA
jgi:hypothetical protein